MKFRILFTIILLIVLAGLLMVGSPFTSSQPAAPAGDVNGLRIN